MPNVIVCSPIAMLRLQRAGAWLALRRRDEQVVIAGASLEAANDIARGVIAKGEGAAFGWHRLTLGRLAASLAVVGLAERGVVPVGPLSLEALCARVVEELARTRGLGRFQAVADRPGLPRALVRTIQELRLAGVAQETLAEMHGDLGRIERAYEDELKRAGLADRAGVLAAAARVARDPKASHPLLKAPLLLVDAPIAGALERELVAALAARSSAVMATVPAGDDRSLQHLRRALGVEPEIACGPERAQASRAALRGVPAQTSRGAASSAQQSSGGALRTPASGAVNALAFAGTGPLWSRPIAVSAAGAAAVALAPEAGVPIAVATNAPVMPVTTPVLATSVGESSLRRLQIHLFSDAATPAGELGADVVILSAPGESRECVEIARRLRREAERGVAFDKMAVLLRAPAQYRTHIQEALRRAGIPAHFAQGTVRPDPSGRAFLALLACAAEKLSAKRFCEYLSLGEVPDATPEGAPPEALPATERWVPPDDELLPQALAASTGVTLDDPAAEHAPLPPDREASPVVGGTLRAPRHWEQLLVEAAVIGGRDRWVKRLDGLANELRLDLEALDDPDDPAGVRIKKSIASVASLRAYALPLLDVLEGLPDRAPWGTWIDRLSALATRAIRSPERVLSVLSELLPMASVGPVDLREVRIVLARRLTDLVALPAERKYGRVFVAPIEAARGLAFEVVFVPGLAEKIFPQKVMEDPLLRDEDRRRIDAGLETNDDRVATERLALRVAVGAAGERVYLSYPRVDMDQSRPRVPSFYGLEVLRAAEGRLPGFDELARRAEVSGSARIGWPAPRRHEDAIDEAEHDLALLERLFQKPEEQTIGTARYLLGVNPHLARALRFRARRWIPSWTGADGLVKPGPEAQKVLAAHAFDARSYSPTALQMYAACPYKFFLHAIHRLAPHRKPDAIEEMDALQRGSLVHEAQFEVLADLRDAGLLPVSRENLEVARERLDTILSGVADRFKDELAPAIDRVWDDTIAQVRADLREWLRRSAEEPLERAYAPWRFELSFGLTDRRAKDPGSQDAPAALDCGVKLRGSIDLVERSASGALRATDYKTGKQRAQKGSIVGGGETLQPVLYALALEKLFPGTKVDVGRLYYCTSTGNFESVPIALNDDTRARATEVVSIIREAVEGGFLPAAPAEGACEYCDYQPVCGPYEELRSSRKRPEALVKLKRLRSLP
jgi:CRISPR/Cas system-associated exonuclease Cas4 (RecB family)